jgi:hypothetical protein
MAFPLPDNNTVFADLIEDSTNTTGLTSPLVLNGANTQKQGAQIIGDAKNSYWRCDSGNGTDWQIFKGTIALGSPNTLSIDTVYVSSASGSQISLVGKSQIRQVAPADILGMLVTYYGAIIAEAHALFGGL